MKRIASLCLAACLLLSGCASLFDGDYVSTTPHQEQGGLTGNVSTQIRNYEDLVATLIAMTERGSKNGVIFVSNYDPELVGPDMERAVEKALVRSPIAAYAVEKITWELGTNSGQRAVAVSITYYHERSEILAIRKVKNAEEATQLLYKELNDSSAGVVMYIEDYEKVDYVQLVEKYAFDNPQAVMETPEVVAGVYPQTGSSRVVEVKFTYQNSRETLRRLKSQVLPLYASSMHSVTQNAEDKVKFTQLYSYLMDRGFGEYTIETSNTPAYSLLWHGAGDSKAFATLYAAVCRLAQLECQVIIGTHQGEPWYWNLVKIDGSYYHLDLLQSHESGVFSLMLDEQMSGYVWNYSDYPATPQEQGGQPAETEPTQKQPE